MTKRSHECLDKDVKEKSVSSIVLMTIWKTKKVDES